MVFHSKKSRFWLTKTPIIFSLNELMQHNLIWIAKSFTMTRLGFGQKKVRFNVVCNKKSTYLWKFSARFTHRIVVFYLVFVILKLKLTLEHSLESVNCWAVSAVICKAYIANLFSLLLLLVVKTICYDSMAFSKLHL